MITFRLHDSISPHMLATLRGDATSKRGRPAFRKLDSLLDQSHGKCWLREQSIASALRQKLRQFDGTKYALIAWVVMPNHIYCLIKQFPGFPLSKIVQSWKAHSARQANKILQRSGVFWQHDYFDRYVRNEEHLHAATLYIHYNPVAAGLCKRMEDWRWSSFREMVSAKQPPD